MGIVYSSKTINKCEISCNGTVDVTLSLVASPNITTNPVDLVLLLDRSGSTSLNTLNDLKVSVNSFIDIIYNLTGSAGNMIAGGSQIGIVSFADTATQEMPLSTDVAALKKAVDDLVIGGSSNHADAFAKGMDLFTTAPSSHRKVIVLFTYGKTSVTDHTASITDDVKLKGITIYCIGLGAVNASTLKEWASAPSSAFVAVRPSSNELISLFHDFAQNNSKSGATNILIKELINSAFIITNISPPTKGVISNVDSTSFNWNIDQLGVSMTEGACVTFTIKHIAQTSGSKPVNASIFYKDFENNKVCFQTPSLCVNCESITITEPCPIPSTVTFEGCKDALVFKVPDIMLESQGRILEVDVPLKNVCPNRRVAVAVIVTELDMGNNEHDRGIKVLTIPAHPGPNCQDVLVECIKFVLPEDLDVSGGSTISTCNPRKFNIRTIANYIDVDYECCNTRY